MAKISQRSLTEMMRLASQFGLYEMNIMGDQALISPTEMRRYLFAQNFPKDILDEFDRMAWNFDKILPAINNGTFGVRQNLTGRDRAEKISRNSVDAESILRNLAGAFLLRAVELNQRSVYGPQIHFTELIESLRKDGFVISGGKLIAETQVIDVPAQLTEFEQALADSKHDDKPLVLHHLKEAEKYHSSEQWGAAASEWRHVFEESFRGAWRFTRANNPDLSKRISKPPFGDVLLWLEQVGFIDSKERQAFGTGFGFLSLGSHPGMKEKPLASLCRTLALPLAHACLIKLRSWNGRCFD